jgi:hypothetical protein
MKHPLTQWAILVEQVNGRTSFGEDGVRDPENPCSAFVEGEPRGDCETDGHYMCDECVERATCELCLKRPIHCECDHIILSLERFFGHRFKYTHEIPAWPSRDESVFWSHRR